MILFEIMMVYTMLFVKLKMFLFSHDLTPLLLNFEKTLFYRSAEHYRLLRLVSANILQLGHKLQMHLRRPRHSMLARPNQTNCGRQFAERTPPVLSPKHLNLSNASSALAQPRLALWRKTPPRPPTISSNGL